MQKWTWLFFGLATAVSAQTLPVRWEELTAGDWGKALEKSQKTCVLPFGILEKHGPHAPVGTDLIIAREWSLRAAQKEYAVVFPDYYFGQIHEAKHQPGAVALPPPAAWDVLESVCDEIARNGFEKILIVNGHGGNDHFIRYFIQTRLEKPRKFAVFLYDPAPDPAFDAELRGIRKTDPAAGEHAGEEETSVMLFLHPDLVKLDRVSLESGIDQNRLIVPGAYTAAWWYAKFPNQYAGDGGAASVELGKRITEHSVEAIAGTIRAVKRDTKTLELQDEFYQRSR
jgi:creatinine amidohydrolase